MRDSGAAAPPATGGLRHVASVHGLSVKIVMPAVVPSFARVGSIRAIALPAPSVTHTIPWPSTCTSPGPSTGATAAVPAGGGVSGGAPGGGGSLGVAAPRGAGPAAPRATPPAVGPGPPKVPAGRPG